MNSITKICPVCNEQFETKKKVRVYCSQYCVDKNYRKSHPGQQLVRYRAWNKTLAGKIAKKLYKYRRRGAVGKFTKSEWQDLCDKHGNKCLCCGEQKELTVDHVVPLKDGGSNTIDNLQPLCRSCNSRKGAKFIDYR